MSEVKLWHRMAADEIKGKLWKVSRSRRYTREMIDGATFDIVEHELAYILQDVSAYLTDNIAMIIAKAEEADHE